VFAVNGWHAGSTWDHLIGAPALPCLLVNYPQKTVELFLLFLFLYEATQHAVNIKVPKLRQSLLHLASALVRPLAVLHIGIERFTLMHNPLSFFNVRNNIAVDVCYCLGTQNCEFEQFRVNRQRNTKSKAGEQPVNLQDANSQRVPKQTLEFKHHVDKQDS
jgi:hypothetical protein